MSKKSDRISIRLSPDMKKQLDEYASRKNETLSQSVEQALNSFFGAEDYWTILWKRMNRQHKAMTTTHADVEALIEIILLAIQYMFTLAPGLDENSIREQDQKSQSRIKFNKFLDSARSRIEKGGLFHDIVNSTERSVASSVFNAADEYDETEGGKQ